MYRFTTILLLVAALAGGGCGSTGEVTGPLPDGTVVVAHPEVFGNLQRPAVAFDHDLHTSSLNFPDCGTCHEGSTAESPSYAFVADGLGRQAAMDDFHDRCIGCHDERRAEGGTAGPNVCGECHQRGIEDVETVHTDAGYDYALHHEHVKAMDDNCDACHHGYDETAKKLVYVKGEESSCRACHGAEADGDTPSLKSASHDSCIQCHIEVAGRGAVAGPTTCRGCHAERPVAEDAAPVPRLERGQPDTVQWDMEGMRLASVRYDHEAHEGRAPICRSCHHEGLQGCTECHPMDGVEEGGWVNTQKAFHAPNSGMSCIGCHGEAKRTEDCAGCHHQMPAGLPEDTCSKCHVPSAEIVVAEGDAAAPTVVPAGMHASIAGTAPEKVTIDGLSSMYSTVDYPHQQVLEKLAEVTADSDLATHFHGTDALCYGCHHHSPEGQEPPSCGSCHSQPFDHRWPNRPGLKGAYHLQCMGCHEAMAIEPQGCATGCHTPLESPKHAAPAADHGAEEGR